eukprot:INCI12806.1.p1 GENE.INCI12806.1~~INCI12806.1.p1  ORF type:complete len:646 (-),score=115.64 INCI12806.1:2-1939(-)
MKASVEVDEARAKALGRIVKARLQRQRQADAEKRNEFGSLLRKVGTVKFLRKATLQFAGALELCRDFVDARMNLAGTLLQVSALEMKQKSSSPGSGSANSRNAADTFKRRHVGVLQTCADHYRHCLKLLLGFQKAKLDTQSQSNANLSANTTEFDQTDAGGEQSDAEVDLAALLEPSSFSAGVDNDVDLPHTEHGKQLATAAVAYHNLGVIDMQLEQYALACKNFLAAVFLSPEYHDAHCNVATSMRLMGYHQLGVEYQWQIVSCTASIGNTEKEISEVTFSDATRTVGDHGTGDVNGAIRKTIAPYQAWMAAFLRDSASHEDENPQSIVRPPVPQLNEAIGDKISNVWALRHSSAATDVAKLSKFGPFKVADWFQQRGHTHPATEYRGSGGTTAVICVKWGSKYGPEYVNRLFAGFQRHADKERIEFIPAAPSSLPLLQSTATSGAKPKRKVHFVCLTDDAAGLVPAIKVLFLQDRGWEGWWNKAQVFGQSVALGLPPCTMMCYIDLDTVVVGDITPLLCGPEICPAPGATPESFRVHGLADRFSTIGADVFSCEGRREGFNSSVMLWWLPDKSTNSGVAAHIFSFVAAHYSAIRTAVQRFDHLLEMLVPTATPFDDVFSGLIVDYLSVAKIADCGLPFGGENS